MISGKLKFDNLRIIDGTIVSGEGSLSSREGLLYLSFLRGGRLTEVSLEPGAPMKEIAEGEYLLKYPAPTLYEKALGFSQMGCRCNIDVTNGYPLEGKITKTSAPILGTLAHSITVQTDIETVEIPLHLVADIRENRLS